MSFREFLNEKRTPWPKGVTKKNATPADIKKGESYTVVNISEKKVLWDRLKHESAESVVAELNDENIIYGSSSFIFDKYISTWS